MGVGAGMSAPAASLAAPPGTSVGVSSWLPANAQAQRDEDAKGDAQVQQRHDYDAWLPHPACLQGSLSMDGWQYEGKIEAWQAIAPQESNSLITDMSTSSIRPAQAAFTRQMQPTCPAGKAKAVRGCGALGVVGGQGLGSVQVAQQFSHVRAEWRSLPAARTQLLILWQQLHF